MVTWLFPGEATLLPYLLSYLLLQHPSEKEIMLLFALYCPHEEIEALTDKELTEEYAYDDDKREIQTFGLSACLSRH